MNPYKQILFRLPLNGKLFGDVVQKWQHDIIDSFFLFDENFNRIFQELFLLIPKKNGKSTLASYLMLTSLITTKIVGADYYIVAPSINVADNTFLPMVNCINSNRNLQKILKIQTHTRTITNLVTKGFVKVLSSNVTALQGKNPHGAIVDETSIFGKSRKAQNLFSEIKGGLSNLPDSFVFHLTTQDVEPPSGVLLDLINRHDRGDKTLKSWVYQLNKEYSSLQELISKIEDSDFYNTNPNLGVTVKFDFLKKEFANAIKAGEEQTIIFLAKHLNLLPKIQKFNNQWEAVEYLQNDDVFQEFTIDDIVEKCDNIVVGIDGGGLYDFTGLAVVGRLENGNLIAYLKAFCFEVAIDKNNNQAIDDLQKLSQLTVCEHVGEELNEIYDIIRKINNANRLSAIAVDPYGISDIANALQDFQDKIVGIPQGWKLGGAVAFLERSLASNKIFFNSDNKDLIKFSFSNCMKKFTGKNYFLKKNTPDSKIDTVISCLNACELHSRNITNTTQIQEYIDNIIIV